jgi:branched-chain amino acid transport system ATP-binding protein
MSILEVNDVRARYGQIEAVHGITFTVEEGEVVVVLGANGAGKTTTLRAICGMVETTGSIMLHGTSIVGKDTADVVRMGVAHVPQGRGTFPELTVMENLTVGAYTRKDKEVNDDIEKWLEIFPRLAERRTQAAGSLSGGEQQMLAVARAMMCRPNVLLLDEPSLGLAPLIIEDLFQQFATINADLGTTMLVVEQNANLALGIATRGYVLEAGEIVLAGSAEQLRNDDGVRAAYLGV